MDTDQKVKLANDLKNRAKWFSFHGEVFLFGVKVWEFRIPPES